MVGTSGGAPYVAQVLAKTFLAIGDPTAAVEAAKKIVDDVKYHWLLYQQAKTELALDQDAAASTTAKCALDAVEKDPKGNAWLAIYQDLMSQYHEATGSVSEALGSVEGARNSASDDKHERQLATRVEALKARARITQ
ncbi:hypothetical protein M1B34_06770 [Pseudomonas sp. MAFF 302030]|uniref:Uncharacterized protein n=1 Tax=Pseudomonas morbosilactucae TaxID=2938197 RepID=A0A9X1YU36_9PSED|nr:hypothetical protein [Pseudomonas morbosilactucae]MCK9797447.1 hypothetical protein [Pseudomonas morbosilactucae]